MKRNILFSFLLSVIGVAGVMAQTNEQYEAALAAIKNYHSYYISTTINDVPYYLKVETVEDKVLGTITEYKAEATALYFKKVSGGSAYGYGFQIGESRRFTNPATTGKDGNGDIKNVGGINTSTNNRSDWETQVFFLNNEGKYAVRATNKSGNSTTAWKPAAYWNIVDGNAGYTNDAAFIWEIEDVGIIAEEGQLNVAVENISNNTRYYITTKHNGTDFGSTTYYLTTSGTLTDNEADAGIFTTKATTTNQFVSVGKAFILNFNGDAFTNGSSSLNHINNRGTNNGKRDDYEGQVFYYDGEHYAIRSTNAKVNKWNESAFWCVDEDNDDDDVLPQANYGLADVKHFVWDLQELPTFSHDVTHQIK